MSSKAKSSTRSASKGKSTKAAAPKVRTDRFVGSANEIALPEEIKRKPLAVSSKAK